jgi:polyphenol oxidase
VTVVHERTAGGAVPLWVHPLWADSFPWLVQGTTGVGREEAPFDLGLSGSSPIGPVLDRWVRLREATGCRTAVVSRQVHGAELHRHAEGLPAGMVVLEGVDGHLTAARGVLLAVSVADCVPVSLVDPLRRAVALVHAGWRGIASGIVEAAISLLSEARSEVAGRLHLHCGPAICGTCYEVGPEVHRALNSGRRPPPHPEPIDLRDCVLERASAVGVLPRHCTISGHCTRCGDGGFFSHRAGSPGRQMGVLGVKT